MGQLHINQVYLILSSSNVNAQAANDSIYLFNIPAVDVHYRVGQKKLDHF